jgi:hypothetical protein
MRTRALVTTFPAIVAIVAIVVAGCSQTSTHGATSTTTVSASTPTQPHTVAAVHPANANDGARMLDAYLLATYGTPDQEAAATPGAIWPSLEDPTGTKVPLYVYARSEADLEQRCQALGPAVGYFVRGAQYTMTLTGWVSTSPGSFTSPFPPITCPRVAKNQTDPVAATQPSASIDRARRVAVFFNVYLKGQSWYGGIGSGSLGDGSPPGVNLQTPVADPLSLCGKLRPIADWFMGDAKYDLRVSRVTSASSSPSQPCPSVS